MLLMHDLELLVLSRSFSPRFRLSLGPKKAPTPQGQIASERAIIRTLVVENMPEQLRSAVAGGAHLRAGLPRSCRARWRLLRYLRGWGDLGVSLAFTRSYVCDLTPCPF